MSEEKGYAERLSAANQSLKFTSIRGKEYAEVSQRILAFWLLFPGGRIVTKKAGDDGKRCDFYCEVYRDAADDRPVTTGHAFEVKAGAVNGTSYVENCETSAIGRALGLLGIGAATSIASADEVLNAIEQQEAAGAAKPERHAPKPAKTQNPPANQARDAANGELQAAKQRLWAACKAYGEMTRHDPKSISDGCFKRTDKPDGGSDAEWRDWYIMVAQEFEQEVRSHEGE